MKQHNCLCLQCGRSFVLALEESAELSDQSCPICQGSNIIKHETDAGFLSMLFGGRGGG